MGIIIRSQESQLPFYHKKTALFAAAPSKKQGFLIRIKNKIMRFFLSVFFLCCCSAGLQAQTAAYKKLGNKVSVQAAVMDAATVLRNLQQQTGYTFVYDLASLQELQIRPVAFTGSLGAALETLHQQYGLQFILSGRNISVQKGTKPVTGKITGTGTISGKIIDEENGEPVAGVTVTIGQQVLVSSVDGGFTLELPVAIYTATLTAIGYGSKNITEIEVHEGQLTRVNPTLKRGKGQLAGVTVSASARREGVAALYVRQKNAAGITDGISAEQMARTPDKTIGESLKRISGLSVVDNKYVVVRGLSERYNGSVLNGQLMPSTELNRKQFSFDIIPSNLVDNVIVTKTLTPDMNAEFGGGLVMVNTKTIPSENFFHLTVGGSVNDKTTGKLFRSQKIEGREYFGQVNTSREIFGSLDWKSRDEILNSGNFTKNAQNDYILNKESALSNNWKLYNYSPGISPNMQVSLGRVIPLKNNRTIGLIASASYRTTWQTQDVRMSRDGFDASDKDEESYAFVGQRYGFTSTIGGIAGIGYTGSKQKISLQTLYLGNWDKQLVLGKGREERIGNLGNSGYYDIARQATLSQTQLKGEHTLSSNGIRLNWIGSYTLLDLQKPDNHITQFTAINKGDDDVLTNSDFSMYGASSNASSGGALRTSNRALEHNYGWGADLALPFGFAINGLSVKHIFKTGYSGWNKHRLFWVLNLATGSTSQTKPTPLSEAFDSAYGQVGAKAERFGDSFDKTVTQHAFYGMFDTRIGSRLRLVYGLRGEYLNLNSTNGIIDRLVQQQAVNGDKTDYSVLYTRDPAFNWFPSANLTYSLTSDMNLRLAYAKSIIRPDLRELSFFREYDFELGGEYTSSSPIISTRIHHVDFRYEWYPSAGEVLSFSLFYKKLNYPMEIFKDQVNREYRLRNSKFAINKGIEMEIRKSFSFTKLPVLKNLTAYGNFTRLFATVTPMQVNYRYVQDGDHYRQVLVEVSGAEEKRPQAGASNYMGNAGLLYDTKPVAVSLNYNYVSNRTYRMSDIYAMGLFERPLNALDGQLAIRVLKQKAEIKLGVSNILNAASLVYGNYYGDENGGRLTTPRGNAMPTTSDLLYQKGLDYIDFEAKPGRTYSMSISYRF
jgi:hypothetical protein